MNTNKIIRTLGIAAIISANAVSYATANNSGHSNVVTCYAAVQTECYGNGQNNCSEEVYNDGLDECDSAYAEIVIPGGAPTNFKATTSRGPKYSLPNRRK